jgi:hypothetical protein
VNNQHHEPWLDALQGRSTDTDRETGERGETREAQGMRQYFDARLDADLVPLNDAARERRLRNLVESRFAAQALPRIKKNEPSAGMISGWLLSLNLGWPTAGAAATALVLGVLAVPLWQGQNSGADEWETPKTLRSDHGSNPSHPATAPKSLNLHHASTPIEFANQVRAALAPLGLQPQIQTLADGTRISANIPVSQRSAAALALKHLGIEVPVDGRLRVIVR